MAEVTLTAADMIRYLRLPGDRGYWQPAADADGDTPARAEGEGYRDVERLLQVVSNEVQAWAPEAPEWALNEAATRLFGYARDSGSFVAAPGQGDPSDRLPGYGASSFLYSGAAAVLSTWHVLDVGTIE